MLERYNSIKRYLQIIIFIFKIKTIRIEHDGSGIGAGWYVDWIEVRHISLNETYK
jgi:hypothetical protein